MLNLLLLPLTAPALIVELTGGYALRRYVLRITATQGRHRAVGRARHAHRHAEHRRGIWTLAEASQAARTRLTA